MELAPAAVAITTGAVILLSSKGVRAIVGAIFRRPTQASIVLEVGGDTVAVGAESLSQPQVDELTTAIRGWQKDRRDMSVSISGKAEAGSNAKLSKLVKEMLETSADTDTSMLETPADTDTTTNETGQPS